MNTPTVTPENDRLLTQDELANRWQVTVRHLQIMRKSKKGPKHIAMGGVRYPLSEVVKYEQSQLAEGKLHENRFPEGASMEGVRARQQKADGAQ
jgi:hypothetical protein